METVTDTMVIEAKKEYRKHYQKHYQNSYKEKCVQISFRVSKKQYSEIQKSAKFSKKKVGTYVKQLVIKRQNNTIVDNTQVPFLLSQIVDIVEEAMYEEEPINAKDLLSLLQQLQNETV